MATLPNLKELNDLPAFAEQLAEGAAHFGLPYDLLVAQARQESSWKLNAYRYEPNFDRRYVSRSWLGPGERVTPAARWKSHAAWVTTGPTAQEWFVAHPKRATERVPGVKWDFVAQTRLAGSHGPLQVMGVVAQELGFLGLPEDLGHPDYLRWPLQLLAKHCLWATKRGYSPKDVYKVALARYNGGPGGNVHPDRLDDVEYVQLVNARYVECWGTPYFSDL